MLDKDVYRAYKKLKEGIECDLTCYGYKITQGQMLDLIYRQNDLILSLLLKKEYDDICRSNLEKEV